MKKTSDYYKELTKKEFTQAAEKFESKNAGIYEMCKYDYPQILAEIENKPFNDLLDAGCGPAPMISLLAEKYPDKNYTGIDLTEKMIEVAKAKNIPNATFIVGDCENLPFEDCSFDVVICSMSAHHYPEIQKFYDSVFRVLRPGGRFILRDCTADGKFLRWFAKYIEMPLANLCGHGDVEMLRREDVYDGLKKAGMKVIKCEAQAKMRLHVLAVKEEIKK